MSRLSAMLKYALKKLLQRKRKPIAKHGKETAAAIRRG